jgi:hypothetical protein
MTKLSREEEQQPLRETEVQLSADAPELRSDDLQPPNLGDWRYRELDRTRDVNPPAPRERLFSRRVLVGWAAITIALYFGVRVIGPVVMESIRESVASHAPRGKVQSQGHLVISLPNGRRIVIDNPVSAVPPTPEQPGALPAPKAATALPVPKTPGNPTRPSTK